MERHEFLAKLGIGIGMVCTGCSLVSCGSKVNDDPKPDPGDDNPPPGGGSDLFSINMGSELTTVGQTKISNGVILARIATGNTAGAFAAVAVACTHQGTNVNYNAAQERFICPSHNSQFSTSGALLNGPAASPLKKYNIKIEGSSLTVSA